MFLVTRLRFVTDGAKALTKRSATTAALGAPGDIDHYHCPTGTNQWEGGNSTVIGYSIKYRDCAGLRD